MQKLGDDIPTITLDKDDREAFQRQRGKENRHLNTSSKETSETPIQKGGAPFLTFLLFILAAGACGASYWLYEQNEKQQQLIGNSQDRIKELENRLSASGEETGNSVVALQVKLTELTDKTDELWQQMDKLWASAWRRNQSDIKALQSSSNKQDASLKRTVNSLSSDVTEASTSLALLQERLDTIISRGKTQNDNLTQTNKSVSDMSGKLVTLQQRIDSTAKANASLIQRLKSLENWQKDAAKKLAQPKVQVQAKPAGPSPTLPAGE